jgi:hypothetical protein
VVKSVLSALLVVIHSILPLAAQQADVSLRAKIPKAWETQGIATLELPPPIPGLRRIQASPDQYYKLPVQPVWKSYPVYRPDKEPPGYLEWLKQQEPVPAFNPDELHTEAEWIRVGEIMFDSPLANNGRIEQVRDPTWYVQTGQPIAKDGTVPFYRYVVVKKGEVAVGRLACAMCHTRVMADGTVIKGAQGNFPFDRAQALTYRNFFTAVQAHRLENSLFSVPWLQPDPAAALKELSVEDLALFPRRYPGRDIGAHGNCTLVAGAGAGFDRREGP